MLAVTLGLATSAVAVAIAAAFAVAGSRGLQELPAFFVWSLPLGAGVWAFARRPRFPRRSPAMRAILAAILGLLAGVALTLIGWLLIGGWMLAWNFPALYCWSLAGIVGMLLAVRAHGDVRAIHLGVSGLLAMSPLALLLFVGSRPTPAMLIVYRDTSSFDAAQYVLDSVLTVPYSSGVGRETRWPTTSYSRVTTTSGDVAALIGLRRRVDRDSMRALLAGNPLVKTIIDTTIEH